MFKSFAAKYGNNYDLLNQRIEELVDISQNSIPKKQSLYMFRLDDNMPICMYLNALRPGDIIHTKQKLKVPGFYLKKIKKDQYFNFTSFYDTILTFTLLFCESKNLKTYEKILIDMFENSFGSKSETKTNIKHYSNRIIKNIIIEKSMVSTKSEHFEPGSNLMHLGVSLGYYHETSFGFNAHSAMICQIVLANEKIMLIPLTNRFICAAGKHLPEADILFGEI